MKPEFPRWTNPYIDKVESIPELLLPCFDSKPSDEELSALRGKYSSFERMYCELGSGSGKHLIERAKCDSSAFYVGFELRYKRAFKSAEKAKKLSLRNIIILRTNAFFIDPIFEARSLDGVYVNFPDPWDRRRWEGNRILKPQMFDYLSKLLKPRGFISYKTDHIERFKETLRFIESSHQFQIVECTEDLYNSTYLEGNVPTEFEGLFRSKKEKICYLKVTIKLPT